MMLQRVLYVCLLAIVATAERPQIWIKYADQLSEMNLFKKYFHRIRQGYFLELGGYNPVKYSNTVNLNNWKGLIVQASQERANLIRDFQVAGVSSLNFALSNVSGITVTFYQSSNTAGSSTSKEAIGDGAITKQLKAITINLADLCHKYYKAKPTIMSLDVEGTGQSVLKSNDWTTDRCVPDVISAEESQVNINAGQANIGTYLLSNNYTFVEIQTSNKIYVHNSKLSFYQQQVKANQQYLKKTKIVYNWQELQGRALAKLVDKKFPFHEYMPRTDPVFVHIRQPSVLNIIEINKHSNLISELGLNRPIIILEYDQKISSIYLGTMNYLIQEVKVDVFNFKKITVQQQDGKELLVYVLDHQKHDLFHVVILDVATDREIQLSTLNEVLQANNMRLELLMIILALSNVLIFFFYALWQKYWKKQGRDGLSSLGQFDQSSSQGSRLAI